MNCRQNRNFEAAQHSRRGEAAPLRWTLQFCRAAAFGSIAGVFVPFAAAGWAALDKRWQTGYNLLAKKVTRREAAGLWETSAFWSP